MYSVLQIGAHQYLAQAGDIIDVQKLDAQLGTTVQLDKVLFISGENPSVGTPLVEKAQVSAQVIKQDKGRKMIIFKRRPGSWQKKKGHRQDYTSLLITQIDDGQGNVSQIDTDSSAYKKYLSSTPTS